MQPEGAGTVERPMFPVIVTRGSRYRRKNGSCRQNKRRCLENMLPHAFSSPAKSLIKYEEQNAARAGLSLLDGRENHIEAPIGGTLFRRARQRCRAIRID